MKQLVLICIACAVSLVLVGFCGCKDQSAANKPAAPGKTAASAPQPSGAHAVIPPSQGVIQMPVGPAKRSASAPSSASTQSGPPPGIIPAAAVGKGIVQSGGAAAPGVPVQPSAPTEGR